MLIKTTERPRKCAHSYKIHKLQIGTLPLDMSTMTYWNNFGKVIDCPVQFFYIEGPEENIIVDTGQTAENGLKFWPGCKDTRSFEDALASVGLKPADVDIIIASQLHFDHMLNAQKCPNARVYVQEKELRAGYSPDPEMIGLYAPWYLKGLKFCSYDGDKEIVPGVTAIAAPGHTRGTQAVAVETKLGLVVLTGFCCIEENFTACPDVHKNMWNDMIPIGIHWNVVEVMESMQRVKGLADIIVPQHGREIPDVIG
jgi:glyoxylase-like metal-dependent hydrolase (beta-lactamase superfamily II)